MRVKSALADMQITVGTVHRDGPVLVLESGAGSALQTTIRISAREALGILAKVLGSGAGLSFVLGLPFLALRRSTNQTNDGTTGTGTPVTDINKPW
jgi:hypothetical protein